MGKSYGVQKDRQGSFNHDECHVWSAIYYLDSPTDYREYPPDSAPRLLAGHDDLVMLTSSKRSTGRNVPSSGWLISILLLIAALVLYFADEL